MCADPVTLTLIATAVSAVGSAASTVTAMQQSTYQARVADRNAKMEDAAARDAIERGKLEDQRYQRQMSQQQGAQRAALAANGVDVNFGNAAAVREDLARAGQEDSQTIRENAMREARGFELSAANYRAQAAGARQARTGQAISGAFDFGSTVLGGVQQYKRVQWNQRNPTSNRRNPWG